MAITRKLRSEGAAGERWNNERCARAEKGSEGRLELLVPEGVKGGTQAR